MIVRRGWRWLVVLGCLLLAMRRSAYGRTPQALKLEIATGQKPVSPERTTPSVAMLVLNAMPEARRQLLADSLAKLAAAVDKKRNPLFVSFDDGEERSVVHELIAQTMPAFSAAASLAAGSWPSREGDVQIRAVYHCAAKRQCVPLDGTPGNDEGERRARFLAWPLGYAVFLAVEGRAELDKVAEALRAPGSFQIGLVLTSAELHSLRASPALLPLQRNARHLVKTMPKSRPPLVETLANLANAGTGKDRLAWLRLSPHTILVVPRLGALATSDQFVADVRSRLRAVGANVEWLASPK
jgi:hypothetical protein